MKTYKEFRPTVFDGHIPIDDRENWLVVPVNQTRDSGPFDQSNFKAALELLGGESESVEVHRFGHWGPGWFEIIIVDSNSGFAEIAKQIESDLENYPVLDDELLSQMEFDDYCESWDNCYDSDFRRELVQAFDLSENAESALDNISSEDLRKFYEDLVDYPYELDSGGTYCFIDRAVRNCDDSDITELLTDYVSELKSLVFSRALLVGEPDMFSDSLRSFWDDSESDSIQELENALCGG